MESFIRTIENPGRRQASTIPDRESIDEYYSDRSRIIYSSSFRRLQQKAQVFSLEPNKSIRTRLTHSLEVSDIGRTLARTVSDKLIKKALLRPEHSQLIVAIVENACLVHDIGNPPFGHFGEEAIKRWAKQNVEELSKKACINIKLLEKQVSDFYEFDGNPQGLRILLRLHCERDDKSLNLTYPTILSAIKYTRVAGGIKTTDFSSKAGYFQSEYDMIKRIYEALNLPDNMRYPLVYIMEAADDICYSLSDIADGIVKGIISMNDFIRSFEEIWSAEHKEVGIPFNLEKVKAKGDNASYNIDISIPWSQFMVKACADAFCEDIENLILGKSKELIRSANVYPVIDTIKTFLRRSIYKSQEAEQIELSGYSVITGLLNHFSALLKLPYDEFELLLNDKKQTGLAYESRLYNRLPKRLIDSYRNQIDELGSDRETEWWLRTHLVIDYISGMTDDFALETYQMLEGISIRTSL